MGDQDGRFSRIERCLSEMSDQNAEVHSKFHQDLCRVSQDLSRARHDLDSLSDVDHRLEEVERLPLVIAKLEDALARGLSQLQVDIGNMRDESNEQRDAHFRLEQRRVDTDLLVTDVLQKLDCLERASERSHGLDKVVAGVNECLADVSRKVVLLEQESGEHSERLAALSLEEVESTCGQLGASLQGVVERCDSLEHRDRVIEDAFYASHEKQKEYLAAHVVKRSDLTCAMDRLRDEISDILTASRRR